MMINPPCLKGGFFIYPVVEIRASYSICHPGNGIWNSADFLIYLLLEEVYILNIIGD
jgi:hypothetical protein